MVNNDLSSFISFIIKCTSSRAPFYLAAQILRIDVREFGEEVAKALITTCPSIDFLYICSGLAIIAVRIPFIHEIIHRTVTYITSQDYSLSSITDNICLLKSFNLCNTETKHVNPRVQALIQRATPLLALTKTLLAPSTSTPSISLQPISDWESVRNTLLRLPSGYFDDKHALDSTYDPFSYLMTYRIDIKAISSSVSKTFPSFPSLLLSSLSLSDFTHKVSALMSKDNRTQLVLQALGDIKSYITIDFSPDLWRSITDCSLYTQALQKLLQMGWVSSFTDAFIDLYRESATRSLSEIRRTAEASGDVFRNTVSPFVQGQLLSFIDLNEDVCILQRRVFLRFFVLAAIPSKVDAAIVHILREENTKSTTINIPSTSFSKQLLNNLALSSTYTALLEPLE